MGRAFIQGNRDQLGLLPTDLRTWLADDHRVWLLVDLVAQLDLAVFYRSARRQPRSRPGYDPATMVTVLVYAYSCGVRSSRAIEQRCREDVAFRIAAHGLTPDHATIARFRAEHCAQLAGLFVQVLAVCARAGMGQVGVVAIDGTRIAANAARRANVTRATLEERRAQWQRDAEGYLADAARADADDDQRYGADRRGDELPSELADRDQRRRTLERALKVLEGAEAEVASRDQVRADEHSDRLDERARAEQQQGRTRRGPKPRAPMPDPGEWVNLTDPESRLMKGADGRSMQGYNAQVAVSDDHLIVACDVTTAGSDRNQLAGMLDQARANTAQAGIAMCGFVVADNGYFSDANAELARAGLEVLIAPGKAGRPPAGTTAKNPHAQRLHGRLQAADAKAAYRRRGATVEPVIGTIKTTRSFHHFSRRGRLAAAYELAFVALVHNLCRLANTNLKAA